MFSARANAEIDQRFLHDFTRRHAGVQRGIGILEDDLHPLAPVKQGGAAEAGDLLTLQGNMAGGRFYQAQYRLADRGLPAAALPYQAERFPLPDTEGNAIHGPELLAAAAEEAATHAVVLDKVADLQDRDLSVHATAP